jgi:Uma2 family endonuclease
MESVNLIVVLSINFDKKQLKYREEDGKLYFSYDDIQSLPDWPESPLIELTGGELYLVPSPSLKHQKIVGNMFYLLKKELEKNNTGLLYSAPVDVKFSNEDLIVPDLVYISSNKADIIKDKFIEGSPDLIIEVLSENKKRDLVEKKELYERYKVPEYVIIDQYNEKIIHYRLKSNSREYSSVSIMKKEKFSLLAFPNLIIDVKNLFD